MKIVADLFYEGSSAYINFTEKKGKYKKSRTYNDGDVVLDFDEQDNLLGIEILNGDTEITPGAKPTKEK